MSKFTLEELTKYSLDANRLRAAENLYSALNNLANVDPSTVIRSELIEPNLSFSTCSGLVTETINLAKDVKELNFSILPDVMFGNLDRFFTPLWSTFETRKNLILGSADFFSNAQNTRQGVIVSFREHYRGACEVAAFLQTHSDAHKILLKESIIYAKKKPKM